MTDKSNLVAPSSRIDAAHKAVFQSICKYGLAVIAIRLVTNLWIGNGWLPAIADIITGTAVLGGYLLSFKIKDYTVLTWPFIILTQISSFFLWFGMGGLQGPAVAFNFTILFIYFLLDTKKQYWAIGGFVIATTLTTIALEYYYPQWVVHYQNSFTQSVDTGVIFICMILVVTLVSRLLVKRYDAEKSLALEKSATVVQLEQEAEQKEILLEQLRQVQNKSFLDGAKKEGPQQLLALLIHTTQSDFGFVIKGVVEELVPTIGSHLEVLAVQEGVETIAPTAVIWNNYLQEHSLEQLFEQIQQAEKVQWVTENVGVFQQLVCFPIFYNYVVVGMVAIAKKTLYTDALLEQVAPFLPIYGNVLHNIRLQRQQQEYEKALTAAKEVAEDAVRAKNLLFTNITHELRTPLSLVVGPVSALLQPHQELSTDARESLEMVLRNSKKMLQYINDIMDLAKLNSSTLELHVRDNHLYTFIESIYCAFEIQKRYRELDYQLIYEANRELVVQFDPQKIEKILNNLLSNAFKYTPNGGKVQLLVREEVDYLHIEVSDTGVGISEEELPHIFKRFYQSKNAQQIAAKGTGIGLALAQELAQIQGFQLEIESQVDKGTRLFFKMPKIEAAVAQQTNAIGRPNLSERDPNKPSILVVEDNHDMAAFVKLVLQKDYNIDLAANGAIGWQTLQEGAQQTQYDLVITDLMMPEMDGFELLRHVKGTTWGAQLPVIVLTARADTESKLEALTIGIDEYLTKPFSVEELTIHVKNLIENAQVRQQTAQELAQEEEDNSEKIAKVKAKEGIALEPVPAKEQRLTTAQREKIEQAQNVVLEHLDNTEFSVDDLAKALLTSKRQLYRFMQLHTGLTPLKFINEIRLQEARRLLEQGLCSTVKEVSYSIGFMSTRHFSKTYSKRFGKKPSEYLR